MHSIFYRCTSYVLQWKLSWGWNPWTWKLKFNFSFHLKMVVYNQIRLANLQQVLLTEFALHQDFYIAWIVHDVVMLFGEWFSILCCHDFLTVVIDKVSFIFWWSRKETWRDIINETCSEREKIWTFSYYRKISQEENYNFLNYIKNYNLTSSMSDLFNKLNSDLAKLHLISQALKFWVHFPSHFIHIDRDKFIYHFNIKTSISTR